MTIKELTTLLSNFDPKCYVGVNIEHPHGTGIHHLEEYVGIHGDFPELVILDVDPDNFILFVENEEE